MKKGKKNNCDTEKLEQSARLYYLTSQKEAGVHLVLVLEYCVRRAEIMMYDSEPETEI